MSVRKSIAALLLAASLVTPGIGRGQAPEQVGKVDFPNSCSPAVQETFQRGLAMLHSFR